MSVPSLLTTANTFNDWFAVTNQLIREVANTDLLLLVGNTSVATQNTELVGRFLVTTVNVASNVHVGEFLTVVANAAFSNVTVSNTLSVTRDVIVSGNLAVTGVGTFSSNLTASLFIGDGSGLLSLNASQLLSGTVPLARLTSASLTANGVVDTTTQSFFGLKSFQNTATFLGGLVASANVNIDTGVLFVDTITNRVGVSKTNPQTELDVAGTVTATAFSGGTFSGSTFSGVGSNLTALNARNIGAATVSNTEFGYLSGVTSAIQTQLNGKAATSQTMHIGTTAVAINRASASLSLTGVNIDGTAGNATLLGGKSEGSLNVNYAATAGSASLLGGKAEGSLNVNYATSAGSASSATNASYATSAGSATTASQWATARTFTIGSTARSVDGTGNPSWSLGDIGAAAVNQTMHLGDTAVAINRSAGSLILSNVVSEFAYTATLRFGNEAFTPIINNNRKNYTTTDITGVDGVNGYFRLGFHVPEIGLFYGWVPIIRANSSPYGPPVE